MKILEKIIATKRARIAMLKLEEAKTHPEDHRRLQQLREQISDEEKLMRSMWDK